ncbi:hypothetical protein TUM20985_03510 [Mycobacterium antarcticum]|uniref:hypothetical protein n=1 Tax=unclassified Mycolicibacterium TaxID=2636767 RepID=UPI00238B8CFC|nr:MULTISPECIES: hypothetical protein [unclassified Mycolicibacterium]BDX29804.1 hypothetical protein TUM20985_03510 [Mycolicibacterium sp. TUM20985]GLP73230.1 hypothetical protein TUM20983_03400 [Mycolicibacterium sp. TUM20983]
MRLRVLVAAATFVVAGAIAGCDRTTPGTVAMTTEAGPSTRTSTSSRPTTSSPRTSTPRTSSEAPPPGGALGVTCSEYVDLDDAGKTAVIEEILSSENSVLGTGDAEIAKTLADAVCTFLPDSTVSEILLGGTPP